MNMSEPEQQLMLAPVEEDANALVAAEQRRPMEIQRVPTIESMLELAIQNKIDPAAMEKLVELYERVSAKRAEMAFNVAMSNFRAQCPAIVKNRDGYQGAYRYADLPEITKVADPFLHKNGLSYTWNMKIEADAVTMTCNVRHVEGHTGSSEFTCKGTGTKMMNSAQVVASAMTYGKRNSLVNALGLVVDDDDDGRRAAPMPTPDADPTAPKVLPRAERAAVVDGPPVVTKEQLNALYNSWRRKFREPAGTADKFNNWARIVLRTESPMNALSCWSVDSISACEDCLRGN